MRQLVLAFLVIALSIGVADSQPVSYAVRGTNLVITAQQPIKGLSVELETAPATKHLTFTHGALAKDAVAKFRIAAGTYKGKLTVDVPSTGAWSGDMSFSTAGASQLKVTYDADHLDLEARRLEIKVSQPPKSLELTVIGEDGSTLATVNAAFDKQLPSGAWLPITWSTKSTTRVMMLKLRLTTAGGIATNVELIPWSVAVDHEDVNFASDSAIITPSEAAKLDASLTKIADAQKAAEKFMQLRLYIAGHTDTVGTNARNLKLSLDRARAIAGYFRKHGVTLPIAFAGFGEEVPKVKTADAIDEPINRRADYVLGPLQGTPPFKGPYLRVKPRWATVK